MWITMVASSFWNMHLIIACATTNAEYKNCITHHENILSLPVVAQQPHPDPRRKAWVCHSLDVTSSQLHVAAVRLFTARSS